MATNINLDNDALVGRLGNKMFVIAALIGHEDRSGEISEYPFGSKNKIFKNPLNYKYAIDIEEENSYQEPHYHYSRLPNLEKMNINGYFQSGKYFEGSEEKVRFHFEPSDEILSFIKNKYQHLLDHERTVSIHVRRGDYVGDEIHHPTITKRYIVKSMSNFERTSKFVFFSDDISWCKESFGNLGIDIEFVNEEDHIDLFLMSMMKNNIISNSSFSWWAAWLNKNEFKKVIYPSPGFGKGYDHNTNDLCPEDGLEVSCD